MESRNTRVVGIGILALLALLAVASPSSAQCVGTTPTGGTSVVVAPSDDPTTPIDIPLLLGGTTLRYPLLGLLGTFFLGRTSASAATPSLVVVPRDSRAITLVPKARAKAARL